MSGWLVPIIYLLGWAVFYRVAYRFMDSVGDYDDTEMKVLNATMSALTSLFWPLVLLVYFAHRVLVPKSHAERLALLEEREDELRERQREIHRLERELGIGGD